MMRHVHVGALLLAGVLGLAGCGDDDGGGGGPGANPAASFPRSFSGTTETDYSYVNAGGTGLVRPGGPVSDSASITSNEDYTEITVETDACMGTGTLASISEDDGRHFYRLDTALVDCMLTVQSSPATLTDLSGSVSWGMDSLRFGVSGTGTVPGLGSSIVLITFDSF